MSVFSSLRSRLHYFLESIFAENIKIKIDRFDLNKDENDISVIYRMGRQKLAQKLILSNFALKYFSNLSGYDRQRITKFSTLHDLMLHLFSDDAFTRKKLINYIKVAIKNDQLF